MGLIKRDYVCPFCFNKSDLYKVEFRCSSDSKKCPPEPDELLSDFLGLASSRMMPKVIKLPEPANNVEKLNLLRMPREASCPHCKEKSSTRICPKCHSELPFTIGDYKDLIFAVIGAKEAGKSHYISILIDKIMKEVGAAFNCSLQALNDATIHRYRKDFYNPLYKRREVIKATISGMADANVRVPLIYTLSFMGKGLFQKNKINEVVTIVFFDAAGEDLDSEDTMSTVNKYICNSQGIIFLLDPLQLPIVRTSLPTGTPLPNENTEIEDLLSRTANLIRKARKLKRNELIDIPIAVAFSKIDAVRPLIDPSSCLNYPSKHIAEKAFDMGDFEDVNGEMESLLREWSGDQFDQQIRSSFKDYAYFGLTSLGCNPHGGQKILKLRPQRVEDPFLWLLWKQNILKAKKRK